MAEISVEADLMIRAIVGLRAPDEIIAPDGEPYIYRWHIIPRRMVGGNVYLHHQVRDDPERPLHDHPWDNQSVILAGGYEETFQLDAPKGVIQKRVVRAGDTIQRKAGEAHRLRLLPGVPCSISLFSTGPVLREWGFWTEGGWVPYFDLKEKIG